MTLGEAKVSDLNGLSPTGRVFRKPEVSLGSIQNGPHTNKGNLFHVEWLLTLSQAVSKMQIPFKDKARADENAQHTWE